MSGSVDEHQTAFVVRVAEAEPWIGVLRERFDPSARQGMPAHITILYPFMPPSMIAAQVLDRVQQALEPVAAFDFRPSKIGRFPTTTYLVPEPSALFVDLTKILVGAFP